MFRIITLNHHSDSLIKEVNLDDGRSFLEVTVSLPANLSDDGRGTIQLNHRYMKAGGYKSKDLALGSPDLSRRVRVKQRGRYKTIYVTNQEIYDATQAYYSRTAGAKRSGRKLLINEHSAIERGDFS